MKAKEKTAASLILRALALLLLAFALAPLLTLAARAADDNDNGDLDTNKGTAYLNRKMYFYRYPAAKEAGPTEMGGHDVIKDQKSVGPGSVQSGMSHNQGMLQVWPVPIPMAISPVPTKRDEMINDDMFQTFGYPVSDTQFQVIQRYNDNRMLEEMYDPERIMWTSAATAGMQANSAANGAADMTTNQTRSAIDFTKKYLTNFTSQANNRWQQIRDQLFIPMAILLLLPGAVLAQVKAIVAQGSPVLGDTNPWEGILRSIIAIFLIPGTFLVINYGIDVSNSITLTIAQEYKRIFGSDMYDDAQCGMLRAFPVNPMRRNDNAMIASEEPKLPNGPTAWDPYEALSLNVRKYDPCAKIDQTMVKDERQRDIKKITRLMMNGANVGMSGTWNVMCAFQMAFLYYLWCMGPIAAALWVWPLGRMRGALPSWIEGVITLCFWSLFWNTVVLLMACFRGVGDSGTVIMSALNFLADICVKYAFDFSGLVSQASSGVQQSMGQAAQGGGSAAAGGGGKGGTAGATAGGRGTGAAGTTGAGTTSTTAGGASPAAKSLNAALQHATAQNNSSGLMGGGGHGFSSASHLPGGHAMPPAVGGGPVGGTPAAFSANSGVGGDHGLPPTASGHPSGTGLGTQLGGTGAPNPIGHGAAGAGLGLMGAAALASTSPGGIGAPGPGSHGTSGALGQNGILGANGLGLHMNSQGQLEANPAALQNMENQLKDPNSQLNHELGNAMKQLEQGNPQAMMNLAANANGGQLTPQTQQAVGQMLERGATLSASDCQAVNAFASGQTLANGQPAMGFNEQGQLMNNLTHQPMAVVPGHGGVANGIDPHTGLPTANAILPPTGQAQGQLGHFNAAGEPISPAAYAQMAHQGGETQPVNNLPTHGLEGLTGPNGGHPPVCMDAQGHPLPPGAVQPNGTFAPGHQPTGPVLAYGANSEHPVAAYNPATHQWGALDAHGNQTGVTMNGQGEWVGHTANGATTSPLTADHGNWYAAGTHGQVQFDTGNQSLHTPGANGAPVAYDSGSHTYASTEHPNISYSPQANSFVDSINGAPVAHNNANNSWYAQGTDGNVVLNPSSNQFSIGGSSDPGAQMSYNPQTHAYQTAGGDVHYDSANHRLETAQNAPVTYDNGTFYGANSNNNVVYDQQHHQLEVAGTGAPVSYSNGTYFAGDTNHQIAYDPQSNTYGVANSHQQVTAGSDGTYTAAGGSVYYDKATGQMESVVNNAPVSCDNASGQWYAAGTNNAIQYDTNTGAFYTPSQAPVTYENGQFHAAGTNNQVAYDAQTRQFEANTPNGIAAYSYDTQNHQWAPSNGGAGGGEVYRVNQEAYAQAMPSSNYQFTPSSETASAVQYGGGSNYYDANQTVSPQGSGNSNTYYDAGSGQYVTNQGGSGANTYYDSGSGQYGSNQGANMSSEQAQHQHHNYEQAQHQGPQHNYEQAQHHNYEQGGQYNNATAPSYNYDSNSGQFVQQQGGAYSYDSNSGQYVANQGTNYDSGSGQYVNNNAGGNSYYDSSTGQYVSSNSSGSTYQDSTGQYVSNNPGGDAAYQQYLASQQGSTYNNQNDYVQPHQPHHDQSGYTEQASHHSGGYSDPVYSNQGTPSGNSNDYYSTGQAPVTNEGPGPGHHEGPGQQFEGPGPGQQFVADNEPQRASWNEQGSQGYDQGGYQHHEHHDHQDHQEQQNDYNRESRDEMRGGMLGQPLTGNEPHQQYTAYNQPQQQYNPQQQQQGGGTFASIIPANWGSRQRQQAPQQPQHPRESHPDSGHVAPAIKRGKLEMGAKQGGYQTDASKARHQKDLLKESWAEFQDGQDEEVFDLAAFGVVAISRPGIIAEITASAQGWTALPAKNGMALYQDKDSTQIAKIGSLQKLTEQAESINLLHRRLAVSVPEFELLKDVKDGDEWGVLMMSKMLYIQQKTLQYEADNALNADRDLYLELLRQTQILLADAEALLAKAGFIADLSADNWGVGPGALEKVRAGLPITADDLVFIHPISGKCPPTQPSNPTDGLTAATAESTTGHAAQESSIQTTALPGQVQDLSRSQIAQAADLRWQREEIQRLLEKLNLLQWQTRNFASGELQKLVREGRADAARHGRTIDYANWGQLKDALIAAGVLWFDDPVEEEMEAEMVSPETGAPAAQPAMPPSAAAPVAMPPLAAAAPATDPTASPAAKPAGARVDGHALTAKGEQWYVADTNDAVVYNQQTKRFNTVSTGQPVTYEKAAGQTSGGWYATGTNRSVHYDTTTATFFTSGHAGLGLGGKAPVSYQAQGIGGGTFYAEGTDGKVYYDAPSQQWKGSQNGQIVTYNYNSQTHTWAPALGVASYTGAGSSYGSKAEQTVKLPVVNDTPPPPLQSESVVPEPTVKSAQRQSSNQTQIQLKCNVETEQIVAVAPQSSVISVDIYYPVGLYQVVDNVQYADTVEFNVTLIDQQTGAVTDLGTAITCTANLVPPFTETYKFSVPSDQYKVRLKRITAEGNSDKNANPATFKDTFWSS